MRLGSRTPQAKKAPLNGTQPRASLAGHQAVRWTCYRIVIEALAQPSFNFGNTHPFALSIVSDLIAVDLAKIEVSRFRMSEIQATHTRSRPHRKRFGDQHSGVCLHIK